MIEYQNIEYFNDTDVFIFYCNVYNKYMVSKCHKYNGNWFTNEGLQYLQTSLLL